MLMNKNSRCSILFHLLVPGGWWRDHRCSRHGPPQLLDPEVMRANLLGIALRSLLAAGILEVADQFLFLRVDRDRRLTLGQCLRRAYIGMGELRIAVEMVVPFAGLPAGEGTGLGLSISHDIIVKQHSGSVAADSQLGEYTEFTITSPRVNAEAPL
jgi:hypothetical protein